jgi:hypothetical protein
VQLKDDFEHALLELDFMEAGCAFGSIILALLTVPTAARSVWRLGLGGPAALAGLGSPTLRYEISSARQRWSTSSMRRRAVWCTMT